MSEWNWCPECLRRENVCQCGKDARLIYSPDDLDRLPFRAIVREEYTSRAGWQQSVVWERRTGPGSSADDPEQTAWTAIASPLVPWEGEKPRNYPVIVLWPLDWSADKAEEGK